MSINKVILVGSLGHDPEIRNTSEGLKIARFSLATSQKWIDKSGEKKEMTEWHRVVVISDKLAEVAENYLKKGSKIYLEGQLQTRKWKDQSGSEQKSIEIVIPKAKGELIILSSNLRDGNQEDHKKSSPSFQPFKSPTYSNYPKVPQDEIYEEVPF